MSMHTIEACKKAIVYHATQCEESARLADFADAHPEAYSEGMGKGLRQLAEYSSEMAFSWASNSLRATGYVS
jgi:hypothetical protein